MKGKQCSIQDEDGVPIGIFSFPDNSSLYKEIDMVDNNLKSLKNKNKNYYKGQLGMQSYHHDEKSH